MSDQHEANLSDVVKKYCTLDVKEHMSLEDARLLSIELARRVKLAKIQPDYVVGIANGAIFTSTIMAEQLELPVHMVLVRRQGSRWKRRLGAVVRRLHIPMWLITAGPLMPLWRFYQRRTSKLQTETSDFHFDVKGRHVILVDDCMETGNSIRTARDQLLSAGAANITLAVLCWYRGTGDSGDWRPDLYLHTFAHFYPWSESSDHYAEFVRWLSGRGLALRA